MSASFPQRLARLRRDLTAAIARNRRDADEELDAVHEEMESHARRLSKIEESLEDLRRLVQLSRGS